MILVIPSIDLIDGESASVIEGDDNSRDVFNRISRDPMELCIHWRKENAKCLHIIDKDSINGTNNYLNANAILYLINSVDIPIQYSSDFANVEECKMLLDNGVYRVVLGELALIDPEGVAKLIEDYTPSRVVFQMSVDNGHIYFSKSKNYIKDIEFAKTVENLGGNRAIYSCARWKMGEQSPDYSYLSEFAEKSNLRITVLDGIHNTNDLLELNSLNDPRIDSCIIGTPLYENKFPCQAVWRMAEIESM